jgi:putative phage-type endonuclease
MLKVKVEAPNREAWLKLRQEGIGASDAAAAVGLNPYKSPFQLWMEKTGRAPDAPQSEPARWGHRLQQVVGEAFAEETKRVVAPAGEFTIYEHPESPILLATLDFFQRKGFGEEKGLLEAKTAGYAMKEEWENTAPLHYMVQVQYQMLVTGLSLGSIAVLIGGQRFLWADIAPDPEFQARLRWHVEEFWRMHVQADSPPPVQAEDNDVLRYAYKQRSVGLIPGTGELITWDEQRAQAIEAIKAAERKRDEAEAHIKSAIGEHGGIVLPNGVKYLWREEHRKEYLVPASVRRTLRRSS